MDSISYLYVGCSLQESGSCHEPPRGKKSLLNYDCDYLALFLTLNPIMCSAQSSSRPAASLKSFFPSKIPCNGGANEWITKLLDLLVSAKSSGGTYDFHSMRAFIGKSHVTTVTFMDDS